MDANSHVYRMFCEHTGHLILQSVLQLTLRRRKENIFVHMICTHNDVRIEKEHSDKEKQS